jgi:hypothetical protein
MRMFRCDNARSRLVLLASVILLAAQFVLIPHSFGGKVHRAGELCQVCVQFNGSGHAPPPAAPPPPVAAVGIAPAVACLVSFVVAHRALSAQPRAPPVS